MKKKVLFGSPNHFGMYKRVLKDFELNNYLVTSICIKDWPEKKESKKMFNLFYKTKKNNILCNSEKDIIDLLDTFPNKYFDYVFFIRPDYYSNEVINKAISKSNFSLAYQWDGLDRFPRIHQKIALFDKFLVFDDDDYMKYIGKYENLSVGGNYYFQYDKDVPKAKEKIDIFYLGAFVEKRNEDMMKIYSILKDKKLNIKIILCQIPEIPKNIEKYGNKDIQFVNHIIDYKENISLTKSTKIIIDLLIQEHKGLSYRFFEAIHYGKKIITTNSSVKKNDFYHPNNIFIFEDRDNIEDDLISFINLPYVKIDNETSKKYSFINWFESFVK
ncbi:hypothetical protein ACXGQW_08425 [Wenyingzhuangia sp. IMCC45533]